MPDRTIITVIPSNEYATPDWHEEILHPTRGSDGAKLTNPNGFGRLQNGLSTINAPVVYANRRKAEAESEYPAPDGLARFWSAVMWFMIISVVVSYVAGWWSLSICAPIGDGMQFCL